MAVITLFPELDLMYYNMWCYLMQKETIWKKQFIHQRQLFSGFWQVQYPPSRITYLMIAQLELFMFSVSHNIHFLFTPSDSKNTAL